MWVIKKIEHGTKETLGYHTYEVGYYVPGGAITPKWVAIKDCGHLDEAMDVAHYLNGGSK